MFSVDSDEMKEETRTSCVCVFQKPANLPSEPPTFGPDHRPHIISWGHFLVRYTVGGQHCSRHISGNLVHFSLVFNPFDALETPACKCSQLERYKSREVCATFAWLSVVCLLVHHLSLYSITPGKSWQTSQAFTRGFGFSWSSKKPQLPGFLLFEQPLFIQLTLLFLYCVQLHFSTLWQVD